VNTNNVNWDVIWSTLRTALVAGGPVSALLIACGFPAVQVSVWTGIGLAAIGVAAVVVPGVVGALKQTNKGKIAAATTVPDVVSVVVKDSVTDGVAKMAADPNTKVATVTDSKVS
jgi:hypothetical protein